MADKKCAKKSCGALLTGGYITAGDNTYCSGHFQCNMCECDLHQQQYYDWDGAAVCASDFAKARGFICGKCTKIIAADEKAITALEKKWHTGCFVCAYCCTKLEKKKYVKVDGKPWCEDCGKKHRH